LRWPNFTDYRAHVSKFYTAGGYSLAWIQNSQPTPQAVAMIQIFKQAATKGLNPEDYDASRWDNRLPKLQPSGTDLVHLDLALTVCAMRYISDLHIGRVDPSHFKFGLNYGPMKIDLATMLRNQVLQAPDVAGVLARVEPPFAGYVRDEQALATYAELAAQGDGPPLPVPAKSIHPRQPYSGMPQLVARLRQLGDLQRPTPAASATHRPAPMSPASNATAGASAAAASASVYQGAVVDAVKHFQRRHGLQPDGILGKGTIGDLNTPLVQRVIELQLALERYRWIQPGFPEPPIMVNIPEFRLRTLRGQPADFLSMKVITGRAYRTQTPVFADQMKYLIFRPYWNVPTSIARNELIPKALRNPGYLAANGFEVVSNGGGVVSDGAVSDDIISGLRSGRMSIRQKPGPKNALGLVKFIFPNSYNVYLHSTPAPELFSQARRDFSHGCIRVENPVGLAAWVLRNKPEWTVDRIRAAMNSGPNNVQVNLDKPIPVLILYSTAVVEPDGEVRFFDDIYGYDKSLQKVLAAGYPYP